MTEGRCAWDDSEEWAPGSHMCQPCFNDTVMAAMELASELFPLEWHARINERKTARRPQLKAVSE